jgi:hypothetical protein
MKAFKKNLELIAIVSKNYEHIEQLETLEKLFSDLKETEYSKEYPSEYRLNQREIKELTKICHITRKSAYNKELLSDEAHIDNQLIASGYKPHKYNVKTRYND